MMQMTFRPPRFSRLAFGLTLLLVASGCDVADEVAGQDPQQTPANPSSNTSENPSMENDHWETATFGAGCFWCVEAVFDQLAGVKSVESGYAGGSVENPTYKQVCTGQTGHAEVCRITFDPQQITFTELLEVFWQTHDPTTLNRQGADVGTQYRSAVFYENDDQKTIAQELKQRLNAPDVFNGKVVTEITQLERFYPAENYHQDYYANNSEQRYCELVIAPKLEKVRKVFKEKLK